MREKAAKQQKLRLRYTDKQMKHPYAQALLVMSDILDAVPEVVDLVHADLVRGLRDPESGREGLTAEQVLRALIVKQLTDFTYEDLAFHIIDSAFYRAFCRLGFDDGVSKSALQRDIKKLRPETLYGHKLCLTAGASSLVTDLVVLEGNPADATLAVTMIERQRDIYGRVPLKSAMDGGFASKANLAAIKALGVRDVVFSKKRGLAIEDMAKSAWVYRKLRDFRAGIEGVISFLKRCFGTRRCNWRGFESFKAYAWSSVIAMNLLVMARHLLV
jgi:IS5 family transposase